MAMDNIVLAGGARMLQQTGTVGNIADTGVAGARVALRAYHTTFYSNLFVRTFVCVCVCICGLCM